ncbi:hypothetical protein FO519_005079 [Halicephalobus sp. NKZ332]|nr:hypothetical protein FO519_005079 [Halicephalobus sp. NKZ332]
MRWIISVGLIVALISLVWTSEDEFRLLKDLRENYDSAERPIRNHSEAVNVHLRILLQQIVDVDEKNQILNLVLWTQFKWHDYKMVWNPAEYGNVTEIRLPHDQLWKPDVILFNSADENFDARFPVNFVIQHTGEVLHAPPSIIKSSCNIDITWFPFDEQLCTLTYGSWTYTGHDLDLFIDSSGLEGLNQMDLTYYVKNGEWDLVQSPARRVSRSFEGSMYVELYFDLHLRRKSIYYGMNWIIPSVLISLSNILGFTLPPECGEKITLQITNLLSVTVFLGMVSDVTPPTSESVPVIAAFFSVSMLILGVSIFFTILVINVFFRSPKTHKMSPKTRKIFLEWLPWLLMMQRPGTNFRKFDDLFNANTDIVIPKPSVKKPELRRNDSSAGRMVRRDSDSTLNNARAYKRERDLLIHEAVHGGAIATNPLKKNDPCNCDQDNNSQSSAADTEHQVLLETLREVNDYIRMRKRIISEEEEEEDLHADWKYMAMVIDRLSLYVSTICGILAMVLIVVATPKKDPVPKDL